MIVKAALLLFREHEGKKELMFVRAKDKPYLIFPGGKREKAEATQEALRRELQEELGTEAKNIQELGIVSGQTPDGRAITMHLYTGSLQQEPHPQAEITAIHWLSQNDIKARQVEMTPMTTKHVLPFLKARQLW